MEGLDKGRVSACACFLAAYILAYVAIGSFDSAYDFSTVTGEIARHDAERALSAAYEVSVLLGLASLWLYKARSWRGGVAAGALAALAAGGFHVMLHMVAWLPLSMASGFGSGLAFLVLGRRRPVACALIGVESALAMGQVLFVLQNL